MGRKIFATCYELEATGRLAGEGHGEEEDDEVEEDDDELHLEHGEEELDHEHKQQRVEYDRYGHLQGLHHRSPLPPTRPPAKARSTLSGTNQENKHKGEKIGKGGSVR